MDEDGPSRDGRKEWFGPVDELEGRIRDLLIGQHPAFQGAVLACLLARWLAGHHAEVRDELLAIHLRSVAKLIPLYEPKGRLEND